MINEIIVGIIILILGGITTFAFKYPITYRKLYKYLYAINFLWFLCAFLWIMAVQLTKNKMLEFIPVEKQNTVIIAVSELTLNIYYVGLVFFLIILFLALLTFIKYIKLE